MEEVRPPGPSFKWETQVPGGSDGRTVPAGEVAAAMSRVFPVCLLGLMVGFTAGHSWLVLDLQPQVSRLE